MSYKEKEEEDAGVEDTSHSSHNSDVLGDKVGRSSPRDVFNKQESKVFSKLQIADTVKDYTDGTYVAFECTLTHHSPITQTVRM